MKRWGMTKKEIAKLINYSPSQLSRPKPITVDPQIAFNKFFKLRKIKDDEILESVAFEKSEREIYLLEGLKIFFELNNCREAEYIKKNLVEAKQQQAMLDNNNHHKQVSVYQEIMMELLKHANTQPFSDKLAKSKKEAETTSQRNKNNKSLESVIPSQTENILSTNYAIKEVFQDEQLTHISELTISEESMFSPETIELMNKNDPTKAYNLLVAANDDLKRPLTPIEKKKPKR
jgi:hypothetical protein